MAGHLKVVLRRIRASGVSSFTHEPSLLRGVVPSAGIYLLQPPSLKICHLTPDPVIKSSGNIWCCSYVPAPTQKWIHFIILKQVSGGESRLQEELQEGWRLVEKHWNISWKAAQLNIGRNKSLLSEVYTLDLTHLWEVTEWIKSEATESGSLRLATLNVLQDFDVLIEFVEEFVGKQLKRNISCCLS